MKQETETVFLLKDLDGEQQVPVDRELFMGRELSCDLVLDKGLASRKHAKLTPAAEGIWVEDLGSTNGTFVNGERIAQATLLKAGDELRGGESRFQLLRQPSAIEDPDATLVKDDDSTIQGSVVDSASAVAEAVLEAPVKAKTATKAKAEAAADSKAPPSWVLNNQQSVDGTAFISRDMLKGALLNSGEYQVSEAVEQPTLLGNSDPVMGLRFQLIGEGKHKWEIGRSPNADVMLNHDSVSGAHAQILWEQGRWKLVDLMSANGTYANGKKCLTGYLASGDLLRFGGVECVFVLPEDAQSADDLPQTNEAAETSDSKPVKLAAIAFAATAVIAGLAIWLVSRFF